MTSAPVSAAPSNANKHLTLIVSLIVGVFLLIIIILAVILTVKFRYSMPSLARMQSFFNPNYNRFDDNEMVKEHFSYGAFIMKLQLFLTLRSF